MFEFSRTALQLFVAIITLCGITGPAIASENAAAVQYLQTRFGLLPDQAQERLAGERDAAQLRQYAIELLGDDYAGSWYTPELNRLVVATVNESQFPIIEVIGGVPTIHEHSLSELIGEQRRILAFGRFSDTAKAGIVSWHIDVMNNSLVIQHLPRSRAATEELIDRVGIDSIPVHFSTIDKFPVLTYDVRGGDDTDNANRFRPCSVGLSITEGFIIAGHCGVTDDVALGFNGVVMGTYRNSNFPITDRAWVEVNSNWTPKP